MTREEKDLLLKDLCARFSYGVKAKANDITVVTINDNTNTITGETESGVEVDFNLSDVTLFDENGCEITEEKV